MRFHPGTASSKSKQSSGAGKPDGVRGMPLKSPSNLVMSPDGTILIGTSGTTDSDGGSQKNFLRGAPLSD